MTAAMLCTGGAIQGIMFPTMGGLGRLGNSIAWWLSIQPYELFLYVFLPPLLLDAAVRIDFFLFKKVSYVRAANYSGHMRRKDPIISLLASLLGPKLLPRCAEMQPMACM
jgi:hypothetical protein